MTLAVLRQPFFGDHLELICQHHTPRRLHLGICHASPGSELAGWGLHVEGLARIFPQRDLKSYFKGGGEIGEKEINEKKKNPRKEKQKRRECVWTRHRPYRGHFYATFTLSLCFCPAPLDTSVLPCPMWGSHPLDTYLQWDRREKPTFYSFPTLTSSL